MALDVSLVSPRDGEVAAPVQQRPAPPCAIVIFGASGDLTHRKLMPALYDLFEAGLLGKQFVVLGFSRSHISDEDFRASARRGVEQFTSHGIPDRVWEEFSQGLHYMSGQFDDPASYDTLRERLREKMAIDRKREEERAEEERLAREEHPHPQRGDIFFLRRRERMLAHRFSSYFA